MFDTYSAAAAPSPADVRDAQRRQEDGRGDDGRHEGHHGGRQEAPGATGVERDE